MREVRWGFLGTGWIATTLAQDLALVGVEVHGVASRNLETAEAFAKQHRIENAFGSYEELCSSDLVDAIYVATPHPFHFANAKLALEAGKHVIVEKPFTMNAKQAQILIELATEKNLFLMEAMWSRFLPAQRSLVEFIQAGAIGDVLAVSAEHGQYLPIDTHLRLWDKALGGGALLDLGIYPLALIQNLLGSPSSVKAVGALADNGVDSRVNVVLDFAGGKLANFFTTMQVAGKANAAVYGTKGRIDIGSPIWGQFDYQVFDERGNQTNSYHDEVIGTGRQIQFLEANKYILEGKTEHIWMPLSDTLELAKIMDEIRSQIGVTYLADTVN